MIIIFSFFFLWIAHVYYLFKLRLRFVLPYLFYLFLIFFYQKGLCRSVRFYLVTFGFFFNLYQIFISVVWSTDIICISWLIHLLRVFYFPKIVVVHCSYGQACSNCFSKWSMGWATLLCGLQNKLCFGCWSDIIILFFYELDSYWNSGWIMYWTSSFNLLSIGSNDV